VRRVLARMIGGEELAPASVTRAERDRAVALLPDVQDDVPAAAWAVAVMELGALVCTATGPAWGRCPVADMCAWRAAGSPQYAGPPRRVQAYAGTDRQCRGRLLAVVRDADAPVTRRQLDAAWSDVPQRERALASLLDDGLLVRAGARYALP
jgi:A/G-specific adenine glycosylase